jgi:phage baseplate assembly protein W
MAGDESPDLYTSFLGTGWSFPPRFGDAGVLMTADEDDIEASLQILFRTVPGERFLQPDFGLDVRAVLFEPMSTSLRTFLIDRVRLTILIFEPRIRLINIEVDSPDANDGTLRILIEYEVRATNSRFNLVFPFYRSDSNEVRAAVGGVAG